MSEDESEEFVLVGDDASNDIEFSPDTSDYSSPILTPSIRICEIYLPRVTFTQKDLNTVQITLPTSFLPDRISTVNGFDQHPILLQLTLSLFSIHSFESGTITELLNPVYGHLFPGRFLVRQAATDFLSPSYRPKHKYRCQLYVMEAQGTPDDHNLARLMSEGFSIEHATRALILTQERVAAAREFLLTGATTFDPILPEIQFREAPLFYFVLEIAESMFKLSDHCCICGKPLGISVLRPSLCDDSVCFFGATEIGLCATVTQELRRDPVVADFLISIASSANRTKWFRPPLPEALARQADQFFAKLPGVKALAEYETDADLIGSIGQINYEILRFILLSNRCHLVRLPERFKLKQCAKQTEQLLCVNAAPEAELVFQQKLAKSVRQWLWHGSTASRWHSILHTGLQDLGKTSDRTHMGADTYGPGVYQSQFSHVSISYAGSANDGLGARNTSKYVGSQLGKNLIVLALCENVKGKMLKQVAGDEWTQRDLKGLIVRCLLIVKEQFNWDLVADPKADVPSFRTVQRWMTEQIR
jgi:hypothetical protein